MYKHIKSLTYLRGIAALIVVTLHFSYYTLPKAGSTLSNYSDFFKNGFGTISYSIYMVHWFVQELLKLLWLYNFHEVFGTIFTNYQALTSLGLFLMIVLLSASLTYRFIEVPERNYLKSTIVGK